MSLGVGVEVVPVSVEVPVGEAALGSFASVGVGEDALGPLALGVGAPEVSGGGGEAALGPF